MHRLTTVPESLKRLTPVERARVALELQAHVEQIRRIREQRERDHPKHPPR